MMKTLENPKVKNILLLLGTGAFLTASILVPTLPMAVKPFINSYKRKPREERLKEWRRFNQARLRQVLKRLHQQKIVEISEENEETCVKLTEKGKTRFLKYKLEGIMINRPPKWDGKWRLIIYDVKKEKKTLSETFRRFLKKMEFLRLQKSVYLIPYPCEEQIEFLREFYGLRQEILYVVAQKLENDHVYREYFGL